LTILLVCGFALLASCAEKKESPPPPQKPANPDLTGEWQSVIQSTDRLITKSAYRIEQNADSVSLDLLSTKSPRGDELVPQGMWLNGRGAWKDNAVRFTMTTWVSGKDTCSFQVKGEMDTEGRLLLHFPADLCGEKSLPYTRALYRAGQEPAR
jgi:hypothetical protein